MGERACGVAKINPVKTFFLGISYNFRGFDFVRQHKVLWRYIVLPFVINALLFALLFWGYVSCFDNILAWGSFSTKPVSSDVVDLGATLIAGLMWFLRLIISGIVFLLSLLLLLIVFFILTGFVNAPFYELLAERTLVVLRLRDDLPFTLQRFFHEWRRSMQIEFAKLIYLSLPAVLLLFLSWIPVFGVLFGLASVIFMAWYFAVNVLMYSALLLGQDFKTAMVYAKRHKRLLLGFGLLSLVPFLGFLLMSFQIVGGTLLYVENRD